MLLNKFTRRNRELEHSDLRMCAVRVRIYYDKSLLGIVVAEVGPEHSLHHLCLGSVPLPLLGNAPKCLRGIEVDVKTWFSASDPIADPLR